MKHNKYVLSALTLYENSNEVSTDYVSCATIEEAVNEMEKFHKARRDGETVICCIYEEKLKEV